MGEPSIGPPGERPNGMALAFPRWDRGRSLLLLGTTILAVQNAALFGAFQIGIKFVKVDDERARYLDMFVGFLDGTLAPGPLGPDDEDAKKDPGDPFAT